MISKENFFIVNTFTFSCKLSLCLHLYSLQAAAFIASIACIVIALTVMVGAVTRRKESTAA